MIFICQATRQSASNVPLIRGKVVQKTQHIVPYLFSLHSIIVKLKQHADFFPAFHGLTLDILQTLGKMLKHSDRDSLLNALDIKSLLYWKLWATLG